jgi:hypothetical protein
MIQFLARYLYNKRHCHGGAASFHIPKDESIYDSFLEMAKNVSVNGVTDMFSGMNSW